MITYLYKYRIKWERQLCNGRRLDRFTGGEGGKLNHTSTE